MIENFFCSLCIVKSNYLTSFNYYSLNLLNIFSVTFVPIVLQLLCIMIFHMGKGLVDSLDIIAKIRLGK